MQTSSQDPAGSSTRPYLIRALHEWCTDNGFTPYLAVHVDGSVQVPMEHVKNNEIVLNVDHEATSGLKLGNDTIEFKARFGGVAREIIIPVDHVVAIYAKQNGQGMAFPVPALATSGVSSASAAPVPAAPRLSVVEDSAASPGTDDDGGDGDEPPTPSGPRPMLKRVK